VKCVDLTPGHFQVMCIMDNEFWLNRWKKNDIGFHKNEPHQFLKRFYDLLHIDEGDGFFVPLCGKSKDLVWLHERGVRVIGVELSRTALEAFARENHLSGGWSSFANLNCYCDQGYKLYCCDFFELTAATMDGVRGVYDRGALVAMPGEKREQYAKHLAALLPKGSRGLLISYAYDQAETYGPPFAVGRQEIETLFGDYFLIDLLIEEDCLWSHPGLAARGVTKLSEFAVLLTRK